MTDAHLVIGDLPQRGRFRWLVSPRSTVIQASAVHTGRTIDPDATLQRLFRPAGAAARRSELTRPGCPHRRARLA
jgi:hypothetical protein